MAKTIAKDDGNSDSGNAKSTNSSLNRAKELRVDDFYTQLADIENELRHYRSHFRGKVVYCNCDDPRISKFFHYFAYNFERLGLKKLITTLYKNQQRDLFSQQHSEQAIYLEFEGYMSGNRVPEPEEIGVKPLTGDGDFRSKESIELLEQADIVVTNPPFSLFREYIKQLMDYEKKFLIVGSINALAYKDVFALVKENKVWLGYGFKSGNASFLVPDSDESKRDNYDKKTGLAKFGNITWFTNLDIKKRHEDLILYKKYVPEEYPNYVNYDAIEVGKIKDIPIDYDGEMGVPISFLEKYNPDQFEIIGQSYTLAKPMSEIAKKGSYQQGGPRFYLANDDSTYERKYERIVVKKLKK